MSKEVEINKGRRVKDREGKLWVVQARKNGTVHVTSKGKRQRIGIDAVEAVPER